MLKIILPFSFHLCALLAISQTVCCADPILDGNFSQPLSQNTWRIFPSGPTMTAKTVDGQLVMKASNPDTKAYAVVTAVTATPNEKLNPLSNTITIKFGDLAMGGSASPELQVFIVSLETNNPTVRDAVIASTLKLRLGGNGSVFLSVLHADQTVPAKSLLQTVFSFPLKSMTMVIQPKEIKLTIEDAKGIRNEHADFPAQDLVAWKDAKPYLCLESHRNPGDGDVQITLGNLSVDSVPIAADSQ